MSLRNFIDKNRLDNVLSKLQESFPNLSKGKLLGALDKEFFDMFFRGYWGSDMMVTAGNRFLAMVEEQLKKEPVAWKGGVTNERD